MRSPRPTPVPADLALLHEFVNSLDERRYVRDGVAHTGGDELATVEQLEVWMRRRGLLADRVKLDAKSHRKALELRRSLRALLALAPPDRLANAEVASQVNAAAAELPLIVQVSAKGGIQLQPVPGIRSGGLGAILAELQHASETGKLDRLKLCDTDECRRVFYDHSKPATRRWCASTVCGNRQKTRAYRQRLREG